MTFQSSVFIEQGAGVPGELFTNSPVRSQTFNINSDDPAYNIIGATCCTVEAEGECQAGAGGALGVFAGFLVAPKDYALFGAAQPLDPSLTLPNDSVVECLTMGTIWVTLPAVAEIGDLVIYDDTTGAIETISPGDNLPVGKSFAYAVVDYFSVTAEGLAVVTVSPTLTIPTPA